jgi:hypothetical protein
MRWSGGLATAVAATGLVTASLLVGPPVPTAGAQAVPNGSVLSYGDAGAYGGPSGLNAPVTGMAATPDGKGYWLVASDGGVFAYGDAPFEGSAVGTPGYRFVGIASNPDGPGYVLTDDAGDVTAHGDAQSFGSVSTSLNAPIVGIAETPDGRGYWLAATDGGVFAFGDAPYLGSMGATTLNSPVVGLATTPDGKGYWLVAADGGVFAFGDARFYGSEGATPLNVPVVGIAPSASGNGYWLAAGDGGVFTFGDATFEGSAGAAPPPHPVSAIDATPDGGGYWLITSVVGQTPVPALPQVDAGCYTPAVEPATIVLACADYGSILENLHWSSWTPTAATGSGTYSYKICVPDCAAGGTANAPASVALGGPISTSQGAEFSRITWTYGNAATGGLVTETERLPTDP